MRASTGCSVCSKTEMLEQSSICLIPGLVGLCVPGRGETNHIPQKGKLRSLREVVLCVSKHCLSERVRIQREPGNAQLD